MRVFGLLFNFQGAFFIDCVMSRFSYVTLHYLLGRILHKYGQPASFKQARQKKACHCQINRFNHHSFELCCFFAAVNVGVNAFIFGLSGSSSRLQELIKYFASPFDLTLGNYFLVQLIIHALGSAAFGLLVLLISVFSRSPLIPFFTGGTVYGIPIFFNSVLRLEGAWVRALVDFSYTQLVKVEDLFLNFRAFSMFGFPVLFVYVLGAFIILLSIAVLIGIYRGFRSRQVV